MSNLKVFISHISEENEVAKSLKGLIDERFLRVIDVFVSSHDESIKLGEEWLSTIKSSVIKADVMIVICSPLSVSRPWINFEAGSGWVREIPVIPMCHSGTNPGDLPVPLNSFQAGMLNSEEDIAKLFNRLANLASMDTPRSHSIDYLNSIALYESSSRANALLRDFKFVKNLLSHQVSVIEHCIYASSSNWDFFYSEDLIDLELANYDIDFNSLFNLFHPPLIITETQTKKTFQVLYTQIFKLSDNIRFILSNNHLNLTTELNEVLNDFLFSLGTVESWSTYLELMEMTEPERKDNLFKDIKVMIEEKHLPPTKEKNNGIINRIIEYYEALLFYKDWILRYEKALSTVL